MGGYQIQIGPIACKKYYKSLLDADEIINQGQMYKLLCGPLSFGAVAISEAMRFLLFKKWVCSAMTGIEIHAPGVEPWVPEEHSVHFTEWGKYSGKLVCEKDPLEEKFAERVFIIKTMSESSKQSRRDGDSGIRQGSGGGDNFGGSSQGDGHGLRHDGEGSHQHAQAPSQGGQAKTSKHNGGKSVQDEIQLQLKTDIPKVKAFFSCNAPNLLY